MTEWENLGLFDLATVTPSKPALDNEVQEVFAFWVETLRFSSAGRTKLSAKRYKKIEAAIKDYGVETCKSAILGCSESDWHQGRNGRGKKYDDIELILRDARHIEDFARLHEEGE